MDDELDVVRGFGAHLDKSSRPLPPEVRARVLHGIAAGGHPPAQPVRTMRRHSLQLALAGGLTMAMLAGGLFLIARLGGPTTPTDSGDASQILRHAAQVALRRTDSVPRPGQFTFVESIDRYSTGVQQSNGSFPAQDRGVQLRQVWRPVDGSQPGLVRLRPAAEPDAEPVQSPLDEATPGYLKDVPTAADAMLNYLYSQHKGDAQAFQTASDLLLGTYLTPGQQAAVFDALAEIPGITVRQDVTDLAGRKGVEVGLSGAEPVIFDADSGTYLGTSNSARLRQAIVDQAGQTPA